jgi:polyisoprenoid-binding protein YceI
MTRDGGWPGVPMPGCVSAAANTSLMKLNQIIVFTLLGSLGVAARAADTYQLDPVHCSVLFKVRHLNIVDFYGRFDDVSGTVTLDPTNAAADSLNVEIKSDSLDTHNQKRDQVSKGPDLLNVKQFPTITFKSTKVENAGADTYNVTGNLTFRGVTKPVTLQFKKTGEGKGMKDEIRAGGETQFTIKRGDFGMTYLPELIGEDVTLIISLEGIKK